MSGDRRIELRAREGAPGTDEFAGLMQKVEERAGSVVSQAERYSRITTGIGRNDARRVKARRRLLNQVRRQLMAIVQETSRMIYEAWDRFERPVITERRDEDG